jgi:replicative DNA helicase
LNTPHDFKAARREPGPSQLRQPPHSIEAEQGVLGCILLSPTECVGECITLFKAGATVFYDLRHQAIYETCVRLYDDKKPVDVVTVLQTLRDANQLDAVGGVAYLASLPDAVPSAANLLYYVDIVREKHTLRRMITTCTGAIARAYEHQGELEELLDHVERDVLQIAQERVDASQPTIRDLVLGAIGRIEQYHQNQGALSGLGTGFPDLDKMTTGLHAGEMVVIAARPSLGKTSIALNIADAVALDQKVAVAVFSLEMTAEQLVLRMLCARARVNLRNVVGGFLAERDFPKLTAAAAKIQGAALHIDDTPGLSILQLRAKARRMHQQHAIKFIVIDYLQLIHSDSRRAENRQQEIADISSGLKALAKELDLPILVLAQLNREIEKRERGSKPRLSDLRESGAIEQDADLVGLLYRVADDEDNESMEAIPVNLLIAKQRNGPTGDIALTFLKPYTRFESAAKISTEDVESLKL